MVNVSNGMPHPGPGVPPPLTRAQVSLDSIRRDGAVPGGLRPGEEVTHYRLLRVLADSPFGVDFDAEDVHQGPRVVLRTVQATLLGHPPAGLLTGFLEDVAAVRAIHHRHLLRPWDDGLVRDAQGHAVAFYAAEPCDGITLTHLVDSKRRMDVVRALRVAYQVSRALQAVHDKGLLHLDLNPQAVFVTRKGRAVVGGFGLGRLRAGLGQPGGSVFAPTPYLAPEQRDGSPVDARADLFALGGLLLFLLTGEPLTAELGARHPGFRLTADLVQQRLAAAESVPAPVRQLLERLLALDPAQRPARAEDVAGLVREVLSQLEGQSRAPAAAPAVPPRADGEPELKVWKEGALPAEAAPAETAPAAPRRLGRWVVLAAVALLATHGWTWRAGFVRGQAAALTAMRSLVPPPEAAASVALPAPAPAPAPRLTRPLSLVPPLSPEEAARPRPPPPPPQELLQQAAGVPAPEDGPAEGDSTAARPVPPPPPPQREPPAAAEEIRAQVPAAGLPLLAGAPPRRPSVLSAGTVPPPAPDPTAPAP